MTRTRFAPAVMAMSLALSMTTMALAQAPAGGGGGGGRGGAGGGPGGGRGGPGGFGGGTSFMALVQMPPVQDELKLTDAQKVKIKDLADAVTKKRGDLFATMRGNRGGGAVANAAVANGAGGGAANAGNAGNAAANGGGRGNRGNGGQNGGGGANAGGGGGGAQGQNGGRGGFGGFANMTDEQRQAFQAQMAETRATMDALNKEGETALGKILDAKQRTRLSQIQLQRQGLDAFRTPELIARLNINDETQVQIKEILDGQGQARRAQFAQMRDAMTKLVGGGANGAPPDRQAMRDAMQLPENQAKIAEQRKTVDEATKSLEAKTKLQIGRLLTKKQKDVYAKALGAPFDLTKLAGLGGRGPGGPGGPGANAPGAPAVAPAGASAAQPGATSPTAPAPGSLRARRGNSSSSD